MENDFAKIPVNNTENDFSMPEEAIVNEIVETAEADTPIIQPIIEINAVEMLSAAKKSQLAAYSAYKGGEKAYQAAEKLLLQILAAKDNIPADINTEEFLHKELLAVRDSICTLNSSLAAEKIGIQLSEESLSKATAEYDKKAKEYDEAQLELQRLRKTAEQTESSFRELLQKQQEISLRLRHEEEKLRATSTAVSAAESLCIKAEEKKNTAEALMKDAAEFDKKTREDYRKLQLDFSQARDTAGALLTQLRCLNADLPDDLEEILAAYEAKNNQKPKKKLFGRKKSE